jgi:hypothetical protein
MRTQIVSQRVVEARLRRALGREGEVLHKVRPESRDYYGYGPYYVVDERNCVVSSQHDLDDLARECGVLRTDEVIAE